MRRIKWIVYCLTFILLSAGCQSTKELHYFKAGENYYRLNVKAKAFASKSRYMSGYFDEHAVDIYFSEMSQPDTVGNSFIGKKVQDGETELIAGKGNTKLVMILSTNSDVVSEQIGNLAQNEETLKTLARLANKDKIEMNHSLQQKIDKVYGENAGIVQTGEVFVKSLDPAQVDNSIPLMISYLNYIGSITGQHFDFENIDDVKNLLAK